MRACLDVTLDVSIQERASQMAVLFSTLQNTGDLV